MEPTKREIRQQKREVKRLGSQRRRRQLKRSLAENREDATDAQFDFGRYSSAKFNGLDRDQTRWRSADRDTSPGTES